MKEVGSVPFLAEVGWPVGSPPQLTAATRCVRRRALIASLIFVVAAIGPGGSPLAAAQGPCPPSDARSAVQTARVPNVVSGYPKQFNGSGWWTSFIVQNVGTVNTSLEVTYLRFPDGECVGRRAVPALAPGASMAALPFADPALPTNTQFTVLIRSFGAPIFAVANQHSSSVGATIGEALSFAAPPDGATTVYLPNVVRRFFGYVTGFLIQNMSDETATATARFMSFDGSVGPIVISRSLAANASVSVDVTSNDVSTGVPGLADGRQYAVTVTGTRPIGVVVNTHDRTPGVYNPIAYSTGGIASISARAFGPYAARNATNGRTSTIVVQNVNDTAITPRLTFRPMARWDRADVHISAACAFRSGVGLRPAVHPRHDHSLQCA